MLTLRQRIRLAKMLQISHRRAELDCSLTALEQLHHADPVRLQFNMAAYSREPAQRWSMSRRDQSRMTKVLRLIASQMAFFMAGIASEGGGALSTLCCLASFTMWVLCLTDLPERGSARPERGHTLQAAEAEAWLMQYAPEARMLHARRALHLLIGYDHFFRVTQDRRFNELLHDTISLYMQLLRMAMKQPRQSSEIQRYISDTLSRLVRTVLNTRMNSSDKAVLYEYAAECRSMMESLCGESSRMIDRLQRDLTAGVTDAHGMKREFRVMRESLIHDGLIDEQSAEYFAPEASVTARS